MPWFLVTVEERTERYYRIQARSVKTARIAFENDPEEFRTEDKSETQYTVTSIEREGGE